MIRRTRDIFDYHSRLREFSACVGITHYLHAFSVTVVRVGKIYKGVLRKIGMDRDIHKAAFAALLNIRNNIYGIRAQLAPDNDPHTTLPLCKKHVAVRQPGKCPRNLEAVRNCFDTKPDLPNFSVKGFAIVNSSWRRTRAAERGNYKQ